MSWHILKDCESLPCLQGQEEVSSEGISWDGEQFVPSSGPTILGRYCLPDSETGSCLDSRFGMMSKHSTETLGEDESMSSAVGSLARTSPLPEKVLESKGNDLECGNTWLGSLARWHPGTSSWRTPQCSLFEDLGQCLEIFPRWGSMRNGAFWDARKQEEISSGEIDYGFLPAPLKSEGEAWTKTVKKNPRTSISKALAGGHAFRMIYFPLWNGGTVTMASDLAETMMGWPRGWTDLRPLETDKFQQWQQQHSGF